MNENSKLSTMNDTECIKLYINFYKLLFLGSPFADKMLNIKLEETKTKSAKSKNQISQVDEWEEEDKEDSGSFIIDTSEVSSSDGGDGSTKHGKGKSPSSNDSITSSDPYQKIKSNAAQCL